MAMLLNLFMPTAIPCLLLLIFIKLSACSALTIGTFAKGSSSSKAILEGSNDRDTLDCFMFIGYDEANDTILLIGGSHAPSRFVTFRSDAFAENAQSPLSLSTTLTLAHCGGQRSTQIHTSLWLVDMSGDQLVKFNTKSYTADYSATLPSPDLDFLRHCMTSNENYIFFIGTSSWMHPDTDLLRIYDVNDDRWFLNLPNLNEGRYLMSCAVIQNILYVIGGTYSGDTWQVYYDNIETIDIGDLPSTNLPSWTYFNDVLSQQLARTYAVSYGTDIIVIGGFVGSDSALSPTTNIHIIDTIAGSCTLQSNSLLVATYYAASVITGNTLYVFSGEQVENPKKDSGVYQYATLPSLQPTTVTSTIYPTAAPINPPTASPVTTTAAITVPPTSAPITSTLYPSSTPITTTSPTKNPFVTSTVDPDQTSQSTSYPIYDSSGNPTYITVIDTIVSTKLSSADKTTDVFSTSTPPYDYIYDDMDLSSDLLKGLPIMFGTCCVCILVVCVAYRIWSRQQNKTEAVIHSLNMQSNIEEVDSANGRVPPGEFVPGKDGMIMDDGNERDKKQRKWRKAPDDSEMMKLWFKNVLHLPQYYDVFMVHGYKSLQSMQEIQDEDQLIVIGIDNVVHRVKIMHEIKLLMKAATKPTTTHKRTGEGSLSLPTAKSLEMGNMMQQDGF